MAFLAPLAIKAGAMIGSSLLANKLSKSKPTKTEQTVLDQTGKAQSLGLTNAQSTTTAANNLIGMGTQTYQPVINYWSSILSGNRGLATSALAPEILRIGEGYDAAARTSTALSPRSGPTASFLAEQPFQRQRDVSTLMQTARPQAATSLLGAGRDITSAGTGLLSGATNSLLASTAAGREILNSEEARRKIEAENGRSMGAGLFDIIRKYGFPAIDKIFKSGGGGGGGSIFSGADDASSGIYH